MAHLEKSLTLSTTPMNNLLGHHLLLLSNSSITNDHNPTYVPISPITSASRRKIPHRMVWGLTIDKTQGMTLQNVTIDIGKTDRQELAFTAISRVLLFQETSKKFSKNCVLD